jgi:hypothetical protein
MYLIFETFFQNNQSDSHDVFYAIQYARFVAKNINKIAKY